MANPFDAVINNADANQLNRHYGGTESAVVADPYISGYHFIHWAKIPSGVSDVMSSAKSTKTGEKGYRLTGTNINRFLEGACLAVTPPGGTLNKTEFAGLGGIKWAVPTNIDYTNTLTIKFLEFHHLPVLTIFHAWVRMIRDFKAGTSNLNEADDTYTKDSYAGTVFYWTTKPDGHTVEYSACYTGVFPTKDPQDLYSGDLSAIDKLEVDVEFSIDMAFHENWVLTQCQQYADTIYQNNRGLKPKNPGDYEGVLGALS